MLAEQVMDFNHSKNDEKGEETAKSMRDDFNKLYERMSAEGFNSDTLAKTDYARLLVGALIVVNNLETRIANEQKAVKNYKDELISRLERIVNECDTDEEAQTLAKEIFTIDEVK